MFKFKVLCTGFMLSSTAALLGMYSFDGSQSGLDKVMQDIAKNGPSESAQRTVDACVNVALSEKNKQRNDRFAEDLKQLFFENISGFAQDVMNEITPEDARELLPLFDSMVSVFNVALEIYPNMKEMSYEERAVAESLMKQSLMLFVMQAAKYFPAFEKHSDKFKKSERDARDEAIQLATKAINSLRDLRAIIEQKARS